jgi:hypothetical protein
LEYAGVLEFCGMRAGLAQRKKKGGAIGTALNKEEE